MLIERNQLANGVRILTEKNPHVRSVSIGIWVAVGSRFESLATNGMSHFIEHMVFKGTKTRSARAIAEAFDGIGGHVNAFTAKEYTCFYAKVLDEHTYVALDILYDMFFHSTFAAEEIEKEKQVVIEEIRMVEDTPDDLVHELLSQAALGNHPLGLPILGSVANVSSFTAERLRQFMDAEYTPARTVITVVGNVPEGLDDYLAQKFGAFTAPEPESVGARRTVHGETDDGAARAQVYGHDLSYDGTSHAPLNGRTNDYPGERPPFRTGVEQRVKATEQAHLCLSVPGLAVNDPYIYHLTLLSNIVGGSMSSRLFQEIREERGLAYSVFSYHTTYKDCGFFAIYAGTGAEQSERVLALLFDILRNVRTNGITREELQKAKEQLKGSFVLGMESTANRMSRLGKNELMLQEHPSPDDVLAKIDAIRWEDVIALAERLFAQEVSFAIVSPNDKLPNTFRRDALV
uniref:M16 family metallopeptidase n=1 Tax=Numidum massiliense TaxID=1522315 RepID=UPI0009EA356F|nr:pitrilysin family protein [Numidum massiliense]